MLLYTAAGGSLDAGVDASPLTELYGSCPEVTYADGGSAASAFPVERADNFITERPADAGAHSDWYVPYPRPQRLSCRLAACEERVVELDRWGRSLTLPWWAVLSIGAAAATLGAWGMWEVCSRLPVLCGGR